MAIFVDLLRYTTKRCLLHVCLSQRTQKDHFPSRAGAHLYWSLPTSCAKGSGKASRACLFRLRSRPLACTLANKPASKQETAHIPQEMSALDHTFSGAVKHSTAAFPRLFFRSKAKVPAICDVFEIVPTIGTASFTPPLLAQYASLRTERRTMGKSNKFDYTNRKNSGVALGQVIGKSLDSEADKVRKDVEKRASKARKVSISSNASASDVQDSVVHHIDLQAPAKDLGDDGVFALADGLEVALRKGTGEASLALEDVNLTMNQLTVVSLARLAPIIKLANYDLKTLNLSNNNISVTTDRESEQLETFLLAFKDCRRLRRLDLSNNPNLGTRAMEVFARVHLREEPVTPILPGGYASVHSLADTLGEPGSDFSASYDPAEPEWKSDGWKDLSNACILSQRRGLRSIPYITLVNVGLTDAGALWLSYVLEDHFYPNQLTCEINAVEAGTTIRAYQQDACAGGIDYESNRSTLGKDGMYLLQKTETVRRQTLLDDQSALAESFVTGDGSSVADEAATRRRMSTARRYSRASVTDRRASLRSIRTADGGEHEVSELESARKRIQRHIIAHQKAASVELWRAALRLLHCSRVLLHDAPAVRRYFTGETMFSMPSYEVRPSQLPSPPPSSPTANDFDGSDGAKAVFDQFDGRGTYAAKLAASPSKDSGRPTRAINEVTNTPKTPRAVLKAHRKGAFSDDSDLSIVAEKLNDLVVRDHNPDRFVRYQQGRKARDQTIRCHLPETVVDYIIGLSMAEREIGLLTVDQRKAVFDWGQRKDTLRLAWDWAKHGQSQNAWMVLGSIGCLAYGQ